MPVIKSVLSWTTSKLAGAKLQFHAWKSSEYYDAATVQAAGRVHLSSQDPFYLRFKNNAELKLKIAGALRAKGELPPIPRGKLIKIDQLLVEVGTELRTYREERPVMTADPHTDYSEAYDYDVEVTIYSVKGFVYKGRFFYRSPQEYHFEKPLVVADE